MTDEALDRIASRAQRIEHTVTDLAAQRREFAAEIRAALDNHGVNEIARAAGLSRSGLYRALAVAEGRTKKITKEAQRPALDLSLPALTVQPIELD